MYSQKGLAVTIEKITYFSPCSSCNLKFILFQLIISFLEDFFFTQFIKTEFLVS